MLKQKRNKLHRHGGNFKSKRVSEGEIVGKERKLEKNQKDEKKHFLDQTIHIRQKHIKEHSFYLSQIEQLGGFPEKNEVWRIRTQAEMNMFTFVLYCIEKFGSIEELYITTYTMNQKTASAIFDFFDKGLIKKLKIAFSESYSFRMPKMYEVFKDLYNKRREKDVQVCFFWVHGKLCLIKTADHHFVCEGSGNFSSNAHAEFYVFSNNKESYKQDKSWMESYMFEKELNKRHQILK